ncbi:unnamed protein product [Vitrella brassicaformis CCMP3155]|uniref:Iron-binding zinc finger CDGSH type domain-containing protein n=2 Tax=Vitrella brassicaformis TaxID=1169539 RepID=A0A0G4EIZ4_VITBC|nr:unnamed protein product [Vitrella brassicaformis CCMP3155]|mmetsp:Transcript_16102/g.38463  ORF Transcript_16102/g.38463 Transcript_16102/m.38463 type:complete len:139 (+) Transcript_16102:88-504(+)|eukprot:CEL96986.1 unnamed protein product [Vitrella brassicaformis CCMP3155]
MDLINNAITVQLPAYLSALKVPTSLDQAAGLDFNDWLNMLPVVVAGSIVLLAPVLAAVKMGGGSSKKKAMVNPTIEKSKAKVVHMCTFSEIEDTAKDGKAAYCRCWRSGSFPLCDGSHTAHNKATGDNVGPLVINCKK